MGNMCCRREMYSPNGSETDQSRCNVHQQESVHQQHLSKQHPQQHPAMSSAYHSMAGDDCAINELLEGRMDLDVLMPDGRQVRLTVERRTPMMDLLVQAASATKISPGGHVIHVFGDGEKGTSAIHYKPSTPIGSLDTKTICIVPKKEASDHLAKKSGKTANRPFEPTFRVQVHLPRNQLTVLRVSPRIKIADLKGMVCKEKGLDTGRYQLVRPSGPTQPLPGDMTLAEYGSTEITLLSNSSIESHICNSNSHIIPYSKRAEESKRKNGILRLLTEDAINKANETTNCNSSFRVDGHHEKIHPLEDPQVHQYKYKTKKRRPAPPPPPPVLPEAPSHSRQSSSDSSGYHEATSSFLQEEHSSEEKASSDSSGVSSLGDKAQTVQPSPPPIPNAKKKKAPAPPPPSRPKEKSSHKQAPACPPPSNKINPATSLAVSENFDFSPVDTCRTACRTATSARSTTELAFHQEGALTFTIPPKDSIKDPVVSLPQDDDNNRSEDGKGVVQLSGMGSAEITISSHSETRKDNADPITRVISEDGLVWKDGNPLTPGNSEDGDLIIPSDHVIPKNPVSKRDTQKKLDLPHLWESEGHRLQQPPPMTVAAKALPAAHQSTLDTVSKESKHETSLLTDDKENTTCFVSGIRTSEKKAQEDLLTNKGEAVSTRVALVALNARREQDVTQQEIASSIQAAFHSVDFSPQPSLLAIKQRNSNSEEERCPSPLLPQLEAVPHEPFLTKGSSRTFSTTDEKEALVEAVPHEPFLTKGSSQTFTTTDEKEALLIDEDPVPRTTPTVNLRRSSSLLSFTDANPRNASSSLVHPRRTRQLQRSLTDLTTDGKEDFEAEQQRLQREYIKLQRQFLVWQQQLMNNHAMLREECLVPQYARTLRQSHSLPEGEDSFEETTPSVPLVSRSLSYEPTKDRCSTLPRSAINITSLEFGSIPLSNGTSTLRSSKTKSYFKPPQVRASTKSRQRLPPEIKREGDVDITDDAKMLTTILPSFESLKLITENDHAEDPQLGLSRLRESTEGRKIPVVHLSATFPKLSCSRLNNNGDKDLKCVVNGNTNGLSTFRADCSPSKTSTEQSRSKSQQQPPPPPPPPPPADGDVSKHAAVHQNCSTTKSTGQRNGVGVKKDFTSQEDPREQLMLEIRKFGGRTALRKISLAT